MSEQEIKEKIEIAFNQVVEQDFVGDNYCVMFVDDMAVTMSRKKYDEIMRQAIEETFKEC